MSSFPRKLLLPRSEVSPKSRLYAQFPGLTLLDLPGPFNTVGHSLLFPTRLFPRVCDYVSLHGKGDFADVTKLGMLMRGDFLISSWGGVRYHHKEPCKNEAGGTEPEKRKRGHGSRQRWGGGTAGFEGGGRGQELKRVDTSGGWKRPGNGFCCRASRRRVVLLTHFRLPASRMRENKRMSL